MATAVEGPGASRVQPVHNYRFQGSQPDLIRVAAGRACQAIAAPVLLARRGRRVERTDTGRSAIALDALKTDLTDSGRRQTAASYTNRDKDSTSHEQPKGAGFRDTTTIINPGAAVDRWGVHIPNGLVVGFESVQRCAGGFAEDNLVEVAGGIEEVQECKLLGRITAGVRVSAERIRSSARANQVDEIGGREV